MQKDLLLEKLSWFIGLFAMAVMCSMFPRFGEMVVGVFHGTAEFKTFPVSVFLFWKYL